MQLILLTDILITLILLTLILVKSFLMKMQDIKRINLIQSCECFFQQRWFSTILLTASTCNVTEF